MGMALVNWAIREDWWLRMHRLLWWERRAAGTLTISSDIVGRSLYS